ncbi:MAG: glycosyltransferase [Clostridium sp.]|nr:glycosyltransferase [Clostridium sp.]
MKTVTIIVPVYNVKQYIQKGIESLIAQTLDDIEIILVDDGSTDGSELECDGLGEKYANVTVVHKENGGVSSARNCGLKIAGGEYIGFMDADDWVSPRFCEILYNCAKKNQADLVMCDLKKTNVVDKEQDIFDVSCEILSTDEAFEYIIDMQRNITGSCFNKLYKRSIIADKTFPVGIAISEDVDFLLRVLWDCKSIVYVPKVLCYYLFREGSAVHSLYTSRMEEDLIKLGEGWIRHPYVLKDSERIQKITLYRLYMCELAIANKRIISGSDEKKVINKLQHNVRKYWKDALRAKPVTIKQMQLLVFGTSFRLYKKIYRKIRLN